MSGISGAKLAERARKVAALGRALPFTSSSAWTSVISGPSLDCEPAGDHEDSRLSVGRAQSPHI
jgi:hypothetical protein